VTEVWHTRCLGAVSECVSRCGAGTGRQATGHDRSAVCCLAMGLLAAMQPAGAVGIGHHAFTGRAVGRTG
jgi:hypothetical protein